MAQQPRPQQQPERRRNLLTAHDIKAIAAAIAESRTFGGISERDHMKAHEAIEKFMEAQNKKIAQMEKNANTVRITIISSIGISLTSGLTYLIWLGIQNIIRGL